MTLRRWLSWAIRFSGLLIFLLLVAFGPDIGATIDIVRQANGSLVLAALALTVVAVLLRVWRWRVVARACGLPYVSYVDYLRLYLAGMFAGVAVPQAAALFVPALFISGEGGSWRRATVSILVDRSLEMVLLLGFAFWGAFYLFPLFLAVSLAVLAVAGAISVAGIGALALSYGGRWRRASSHRLPPMVARFFSFAELKQWGPTAKALSVQLGPLAVTSLGILTLQVAVAASVAGALDIHVSPVYFVATFSLVILVASLPISVLGLGPREGMLIALLPAAGVAKEEALALGVLLAAVTLTARLPGVVSWFWQRRVSTRATTLANDRSFARRDGRLSQRPTRLPQMPRQEPAGVPPRSALPGS